MLIYTSLLNLIYFVVCTVMFCKYGSPTSSFVNLTVIVVMIVLFLVVFLRFYLYPDPCDYFRYSFRNTSLALSHYYIKTVFLLVTSILLSPVLDTAFAAPVPCLMILVSTLAYKPYQDYWENIRIDIAIHLQYLV